MTRLAFAAVVVAASVSFACAESAPPAQDPAPAAQPAPASSAPAPANAPDLEAGANSFKKCMPCHRVGEGTKSPVGPTLNGLDGRKAGTVEGYNYSDANKNSGLTWNEETFKEYITNPRAVIPKTKMVFAGISSANERNNLWAYLKQFDADGKIKKQ